MVSGVEIAAISAVLLAATVAIVRMRLGAVGFAMVAAVVGGTLMGGLSQHQALTARAEARNAVLRRAPQLQREDDGFTSSDSCRACHPREYKTWHDSYHRSMTQLATPQTVRGNFEGVTLEDGGRTYKLSRSDEGFFVDVPDFEWERRRAKKGMDAGPPEAMPRVKRRLVLTTGSHYMQTYWYASKDGKEMINFPFVFLFDEQTWVPREHVFLRPPDAPRLRQRWNDNCLGCHTTFGVPGGSREGWDTEVAELGIACEACHGPGEAHAQKHRGLISRYIAHLDGDPDDTIVNPARLSPARSSEVCAQCHSKSWINDAKKWNDEGLEFRPGKELAASKTVVLPRSKPDHPWLIQSKKMDPAFESQFFWPDGMVRVSGREYNGMAESACFAGGEMACTSCHSLHDSDPTYQLRRDESQQQTCLSCHQDFAADPTAHSHHPAGSSGSECVNCHMPYTSYGLMRALRSHLVDSPSVGKSVATGRPIACNQCHLDRTLAWTDEHMQQWYGAAPAELSQEDRTTSAAVRWLLEGDAAQRAITAWTFGWKPAQAVSGTDWIAPLLAPLLGDDYATVRYIAGHSLRTLPGFEDFEYDFLAKPDERSTASDQVRSTWTAPAEAPAAVLAPDHEAISRAWQQRDTTPVDLKE